MFGRFNSLINMNNVNNNKYFVPKTKFLSMTNLLESDDVTVPDHGEAFLKYTTTI